MHPFPMQRRVYYASYLLVSSFGWMFWLGCLPNPAFAAPVLNVMVPGCTPAGGVAVPLPAGGAFDTAAIPAFGACSIFATGTVLSGAGLTGGATVGLGPGAQTLRLTGLTIQKAGPPAQSIELLVSDMFTVPTTVNMIMAQDAIDGMFRAGANLTRVFPGNMVTFTASAGPVNFPAFSVTSVGTQPAFPPVVTEAFSDKKGPMAAMVMPGAVLLLKEDLKVSLPANLLDRVILPNSADVAFAPEGIVEPMPEPTTATLVGIGILGVMLITYRERQHSRRASGKSD